MVEHYSDWMSACKRQVRDLSLLNKRIDLLRRRLSKFLNINLSTARSNRNYFENYYNEVKKIKNECDTIFSEMGRLGDAMKHYSNQNKVNINELKHKADEKYRHFEHLIREAEAREKRTK